MDVTAKEARQAHRTDGIHDLGDFMRTTEGRPSREEVGAPQLARATQDSSTTSTRAHGLAAPAAGHERRWDRRHRVDGTEVAAWCAFTLICAALILAACALTWLVAS